MRTPEEKVEEILRLKGQGLSSRQIAMIVGVGKSTVNDWAVRSSTIQEESKKQS